MADKIPPFTLKPEIQEIGEEIKAAINEVIDSGMFILGETVKRFERQAAEYLGVEHAIGVNSGTDALVIALRALGIGPGDEVIVPSFTFFATAESVSAVGATPVFADIEPASMNIDPASVAEAVTGRTKAIIPVHLFGHAADLDAIMEIARGHGLKVIEDTAQAFGGEYKGGKLGTIGDAGAFSFFPTKNLGCYGDGGLVATNDGGVAELARKLRTHGAVKKYANEILGYNSRLDAIQAAVLSVKLPRLDAFCDARREAAARYAEMLADIPGVSAPTEADYARHVYHQYTVRVTGADRDAMREKILAAGIICMVYYPTPVHRLPAYGIHQELPETEKAAKEVLSLPIWPQITAETQRRVADVVAAALEA